MLQIMRAVMRGLWLACRHGGARLLPGPAPCRAGREAMRLAGSQAALRSSAAAFSKCPTYPRNVWLHCSRTRQQRARFVTTAVRSKDIQADVGLLVEGEPRLRSVLVAGRWRRLVRGCERCRRPSCQELLPARQEPLS